MGPPDQVSLDEGQAGSEIEVPVGAPVEIVLEENPSTGFRWNWGETGELEVRRGEWAAGGPGVGVAGRRRLSVRVTTEGRHELHLRLSRSWNDQVDRELRFTLLARRTTDTD